MDTEVVKKIVFEGRVCCTACIDERVRNNTVIFNPRKAVNSLIMGATLIKLGRAPQKIQRCKFCFVIYECKIKAHPDIPKEKENV